MLRLPDSADPAPDTRDLHDVSHTVAHQGRSPRISPRHTQHDVFNGTRLRDWARHSAGLSLAAIVIPALLLSSMIVPGDAQPDRAGGAAATFALQGTLGAFMGDMPAIEQSSTQESPGGAAAGMLPVIEGTLSFGDHTGTPAADAPTATVTGATVNLRRGPGTEHAVIGKLQRGTQLQVLDQQDGWYLLLLPDDITGWASTRYVTIEARQETVPAPAPEPTPITETPPVGETTPVTGTAPIAETAPVTETAPIAETSPVTETAPTIETPPNTDPLPAVETAAAPVSPAVAPAVESAPSASPTDEAVRIALAQVGAPYRWGGTTPNGFDCSGLTRYVYRQLGIELPHKASLQSNTRYGQRVGTYSELMPGDLMFFVRTTSARGITHVGIYVGDGRMVTANTPRTGVQNVSISAAFWQSRFVGGIRPLQ